MDFMRHWETGSMKRLTPRTVCGKESSLICLPLRQDPKCRECYKADMAEQEKEKEDGDNS